MSVIAVVVLELLSPTGMRVVVLRLEVTLTSSTSGMIRVSGMEVPLSLVLIGMMGRRLTMIVVLSTAVMVRITGIVRVITTLVMGLKTKSNI